LAGQGGIEKGLLDETGTKNQNPIGSHYKGKKNVSGLNKTAGGET